MRTHEIALLCDALDEYAAETDFPICFAYPSNGANVADSTLKIRCVALSDPTNEAIAVKARTVKRTVPPANVVAAASDLTLALPNPSNGAKIADTTREVALANPSCAIKTPEIERTIEDALDVANEMTADMPRDVALP